MFRPASRSILRSAVQSSFTPVRTTTIGRRFASTSPANARRSWKSSAVRWGIAIAGIYYYNTSTVFAEQPQHNLLNPNLEALEDTHDETSLEALTLRRSRQAEKNAAVLHSAADSVSSENASLSVTAAHEGTLDPGSAGDLEEEAESQGAFNPETGEINWDCPCLGGMAHGPCGPEFREAFSCFVYSTEEPKGMDCIDKFQNMQQCFQKYPEIYKGELEDDEELDAGLEAEKQELLSEIQGRRAQQEGTQRRLLEEPDPVLRPAKKAAQGTQPIVEDQSRPDHTQTDKPPQVEGEITSSDDESLTLTPERENILEGQKSLVTEPKRGGSSAAEEAVPEADEPVPKAAHDATGSSGSKPEK